MWELFTRGQTPYICVENHEIPSHLASGKRLEKPENTHQLM